MLSEEKQLWLEEYKELGLEVRQFNSETYTTNRLMLPPLVIGLLVLYGEVDKFLGVEINNPDAVHQLVWFGCVVISLIWICNVSRLAQLSYLDRVTIRQREGNLGLKGHGNVYATDEKMVKDLPVTKILRHSRLRFIGFGIYFSLLLFKLKSMDFHGVLSFLNSIEWWFILGIAIIVSAYVSGSIWYIYFKAPFCASQASPTELWDTKRRKFQDNKRQRFQMSMNWIFQYIMKPTFQYIIPIIIFLGLFALPILMYADLQEQPDANACLVRGLKNFAEGEYTEAIEDFNVAIAVDSNNAGAYFKRGSAYFKKREFANAIVDLDKAIALDPQNQSARDLRNKAQRELENLAKQ